MSGRHLGSGAHRRGAAAIVWGMMALWLLGCSPKPSAEAIGSSQLTELQDVGALREVFNQDAGKARLVLMLAPT